MKKEELQGIQPHVYQYFQNVLQQGRLAHAYLFSGDFASFEMAIFLSQAIFCENKVAEIPCGQCRSCRLIEQGEFADVSLVSPQGNTIKTETIRNLVKQFSQSGFESNRQVFIIRDAEKMHPNAANSLLKVIEEPQSDIRIFLLTNQEHAVLATIKSRVQIVSFPKNLPVLERMLEEKGLLKTQAQLIARLVASIEEAQQLAVQKSFLELITVAKKWLDVLFKQPNKAYLQVGSLVRLADEKADQARLFELLTLLLAERMTEPTVLTYLENLQLAHHQWQSNVSLQNALEYWLLLTEKQVK
ncbi:DNA polymerase III subunit delta' [Streptococcus acidominimus]|uniref:DNA polymerase III subunit delta n=1 Tax=Streptococcus acidominimus TaxID=1326 RepID=A0A1Q8EE10_STRAI|nr:DNA polymerase III subunit delta' [Streptococcus acidominimus]MBF0846328.1 DNA polymerase III subunit delta' [Streptococcus danieliae]MBF0819403.1 DNA polymerase III subunit delta' [Streptococcus acidominimus]MBF0837863.1 DNA polymerase III subunit delta' [Streptococcus acidominimus]OLF49993.1 DNA polymerase III subunit delta' [Streptococcus acidominimus]TFU29917.1 DNA polymerase III subunit delta' [Streptococcus acidominimus]